ncbi:MAG: hypothetical protein BWY85_00053 [Firmicutes bacterium ADurb.Bin506]|nr:MAG: hypothetical protein BWY85_00053 [Firmicutes bacterium ADurb.Bin506]
MEQRIEINVEHCGFCTTPGACQQLDKTADEYVIDLTGGLMSSTHAACVLRRAQAAGGKPVHLRLNRRNFAIAHALGMDHLATISVEVVDGSSEPTPAVASSIPERTP